MGALKNLNITGPGPAGKEHYGHPNANPNPNPLHPNAGGGGQWNHGPPPAAGPPYQPHVNAHPLPVRPPPAKEKEKKEKDKGFKLKNIFKGSKKGSTSPGEDPSEAARRAFGAAPAGFHGSSGHGYYQGAEQQQPPYAQGGPQPGAGGWDQPGRNAYYNHSDGSGSSQGSRPGSRGTSFDQGGGYPAPQHLRQHDFLAGGGSAHGRGGYGVRAPAEPSRLPTQHYEEQEPPEDLLCPISGALMAEPVIVPSGATYEKRCFEAWYNSGQRYCLQSNIVLEAFSFFPNIGVAKKIATWCEQNQRRQPDPPSAELAVYHVQRILGELAASGNDAHLAGTAEYMAAPSMGAEARGPRSDRYLVEGSGHQEYVAPVVPAARGGPRSESYLVEGTGQQEYVAPVVPAARGGPRSDPYLVEGPASIGSGARGPPVHARHSSSSSDEESSSIAAPIGPGARGPRADTYLVEAPVKQEYGAPVGPGARGPRSDAFLGDARPGARGPRSDAYLGDSQVQQEYAAPSGPGAGGPPVHIRHSSSSSDEENSSVAGPIGSAAHDPPSDAYLGEGPVQQEYVTPIGQGAHAPPVHVRHSSSSSDEESSNIAGEPQYVFRPAALKVDPHARKAFAPGLDFSPPADMRDAYAHGNAYRGPAVESPYAATHGSEDNGDDNHVAEPESSFPDGYGDSAAESYHETQAKTYYTGDDYARPESGGNAYFLESESSGVPEDNAGGVPQEGGFKASLTLKAPELSGRRPKAFAVGMEFSPPADTRDTYGHNGDVNDVAEPESSFPEGYGHSAAESYHQPQAETYYTGDDDGMPGSGGAPYFPESESSGVPEDNAGGVPQEGGFKASLTPKAPELSGRRPSAPSEPGNNFRPPSLIPQHFSGDSDGDSPRSDSSGDTPRSRKHGSVHGPGPLFGPTSWNSGSATDSVRPTAPSDSGPERPTSDFARLQIAKSQYGVPPADGVPSGLPSVSIPDSQSVRGQYGLPAAEGLTSGSLGSRGSRPFSGPHSGSSSSGPPSGPPSGSFPTGLHRREESEPVGRPPRFNHSSSWLPSDRSQDGLEPGGHSLPLPLNTIPTSYSDTQSPLQERTQEPFPDVVQKLYGRHPKEQEEGAAEIRMLTRESADNRIVLCSGELADRVLGGLIDLLSSRHPGVQVNAAAAIMNLSLEKENKLKMARAGVIPHLIDLLQRGVGEAQEIAAGAMFSLSLDDENKMAIGVLGGIPHLVQILRAGRPGARRDAAMALYHLSFVQMNRTKLVRAGGVNILLQIARENQSDLVSRALLILSHLALIPEGRAALSEMSNISTLVALLKGPVDGGSGEAPGENWAEVREHAAAALYQLSNHNMRFRSQVMQAGAEEYLIALTSTGTPRAREKASSLLRIMRDVPGQDSGRKSAYPMRGRYNGRDQVGDQNSALF